MTWLTFVCRLFESKVLFSADFCSSSEIRCQVSPVIVSCGFLVCLFVLFFGSSIHSFFQHLCVKDYTKSYGKNDKYDRAPVLVHQPSPVMWGQPWTMAWVRASDIALIKTFQKHSHV